MALNAYFENAKGIGVLATADGEGHVNTAIYSRPHIMDDGTLAFIMNDRLSHYNLQSNPKACFLFKEGQDGYRGKRLYLTKIREERDSDLLQQLKRRSYPPKRETHEPKYLVFFKLDKELP
ncbi:MAG: pyridoxamine 5'-phosphate oxidase family protein [Desulfatitalea sp.]|nr:pyridoxamine 5'-phosphate oxidase family protein [Desulfatitalea sp.]NNK01497.1 pyridoxamine 5'-phosphate oxidase family protein [Desulfatitalea sp.]